MNKNMLNFSEFNLRTNPSHLFTFSLQQTIHSSLHLSLPPPRFLPLSTEILQIQSPRFSHHLLLQSINPLTTNCRHGSRPHSSFVNQSWLLFELFGTRIKRIMKKKKGVLLTWFLCTSLFWEWFKPQFFKFPLWVILNPFVFDSLDGGVVLGTNKP